MGKATTVFYKRLASKLSDKRNQPFTLHLMTEVPVELLPDEVLHHVPEMESIQKFPLYSWVPAPHHHRCKNLTLASYCMFNMFYDLHISNVPVSKWRLLSNVLVRVGKTGETAFSLSSQFHVCSCEWYKLYSGKRCIPGEGKRVGGETVGFQYPVWLLHNIDG